MSIILGIRLLIAIAVIVFAVRLWFRLFSPQASARRIRRVTRTVIIVIGLLIVAEQSFLYFWLDREVQQRHQEHMAFLEKAKSRPNGLEGIRWEYCEKRRVALIYSYQLCIHRLLIAEDDPRKERFAFYGVKPAGYLTLLPWDYSDRSMFFGFGIAYLDASGEVVNSNKHEN